ncbi:MAG TPA: 4'-phosphopantetheinyl transferase superfamily protein [Prolixibacteraceae bacterium]|nr:4'-phosphopantetheinyl transferase superfamily protein [Prolixibacteraceae bacterium]HPR61388.1 4'-phosphopantetheinyl transferase superfamily protein [Prolixibacteraceae bacterium]
MPLIYNQYEHTYRVALWALTEPLSFFEDKVQLSQTEKKTYQQINNECRKKEWLAVRLLLWETLGFWPSIVYAESGKPILQNHSRHLSISHAKTMVGILLCTNPYAGIDIEPTNRNIEKVAKRFLSEQELSDIETTKLPNSQILYWCAKEAIFKAVNENNISFSKQIHVKKVLPEGKAQATFVTENKTMNFELKHIELDNHLIVWTT